MSTPGLIGVMRAKTTPQLFGAPNVKHPNVKGRKRHLGIKAHAIGA
jgi:hypothetical protein